MEVRNEEEGYLVRSKLLGSSCNVTCLLWQINPNINPSINPNVNTYVYINIYTNDDSNI